MPKAATAFVDFQGDFSQIDKQTAGQGKKLESTFGQTFKNIAKGAALSLAGIGVSKVLKDSFAQAQESEKVGRQTEAVLKSTGSAAGVTAGQVSKLATSLSGVAGVDDEVIKSGENVLLTFTNVRNSVGKGNDIFNQATTAATDLSAALGQDMQSSVIQLGKALNDPIKGVTALQRVGVSFTASQKKQIKTLVDSGHTLEAQKLILGELKKEFGGAAAAAATPTDKLQVSVHNLEESGGKLLTSVIGPLAIALSHLAEFLNQNHAAAVALGVVVGTLTTLLLANKAATLLTTAASTAATVATAVWTAAQWLFNAAMAANPVVLAVAAIVALGAAIFVAYKKFGPFHDAVDKVWQLLQTAFHWVQSHWPLLLAILTGPFGLATLFIIKHWDDVVGFFKKLPGRFVDAIKTVATVLTSPFRSAFNGIARLWNNTVGKLHFKIPGWVPGIGGKGFDVPDIPTLHTGGLVPGSGDVLAMLRAGEGVFTPGQMRALGAGVARPVDVRTTVSGTGKFVELLQELFDDHDRQLSQALMAGSRG